MWVFNIKKLVYFMEKIPSMYGAEQEVVRLYTNGGTQPTSNTRPNIQHVYDDIWSNMHLNVHMHLTVLMYEVVYYSELPLYESKRCAFWYENWQFLNFIYITAGKKLSISYTRATLRKRVVRLNKIIVTKIVINFLITTLITTKICNM